MSQILQAFSAQYCKGKVPVLRPGYLVKVHQKIKEGGKERIQVFTGTVIQNNSGHATDSTFTVRKVSEGIGVEKIFPYHSPNVVKIEVVRAHKVRRSKLNYLRDLSGKALRMKEIDLDLEYQTFEKAVQEAQKTEEVAEDITVEEVLETPQKEEVQTPAEEKDEAKTEETPQENPSKEESKQETPKAEGTKKEEA